MQEVKTKLIESLVAWVMPSQVQQDTHTEEYRKARLICFSLLIVSLCPIVYAPLYWFISYEFGLFILFLIALCAIAVILYFRKTGNTIVTGNLFAVISYLMVMGLALSNQSFSGILWLLLTPISAFLYANTKSGYIWSVISLSTISGYYIGLLLGYEYPMLFNPEYRILSESSTAIGLFAIIIAIIMVYEKEKNALINRIKTSNFEINIQNEQIKQKQEEILTINNDLATKNSSLETVSELLSDRNTKMLDSLRYAHTIQEAILPSAEKMAKAFTDFFVLYRPKDIVSGDFYWLEGSMKDEGPRFLAVGDCTGHGVPGAFMSIITHAILDEVFLKKHILEPHLALEETHLLISKALKQDTSDNTDGADLAICAIQTIEDQIKVSVAGAKMPILLSEPSKEKIQLIKGTNRSIGGYQSKKTKEFVSHEFIVEKGTSIYMLSDGFADQNNSQNKKIGTSQLLDTLLSIRHLAFSEQKQILEDMLDQHQGDIEQRDDITIIGYKL